jgi:uncharacterized repeat protein (TIGR03899 family)
MEDLLGFGKGTEKLLDVMSKAVGTLYKPISIKKEGEAEAYKYKLVQEAKIDSKVREIKEVAVAKAEAEHLVSQMQQKLDERIRNRNELNERRKQLNIEAVLENAINNNISDKSEENVDPDWLIRFIEHAEEANSDKMQELWGKILAGEISKPGSFSIKALKTIKNMTQKEANVFQKACAIVSTLKGREETDNKLIILGYFIKSHIRMFFENHEKELELNNYDISFADILTLQDIGLLHSEKLLCRPFEKKGEQLDYICNGINFPIIAWSKNFQLIAYKLTPLGSELSKLIDNAPNSKYINDIKLLFKR